MNRNSEVRDPEIKILAKFSLIVWDDLKAQGATDREALALVYRAGADHLTQSIKLMERPKAAPVPDPESEK